MESEETYDVVGPICESSDVFDKGIQLPTTRRGDLLAIRSAGAYGEIMASQYNCRRLPEAYTIEEIEQGWQIVRQFVTMSAQIPVLALFL